MSFFSKQSKTLTIFFNEFRRIQIQAELHLMAWKIKWEEIETTESRNVRRKHRNVVHSAVHLKNDTNAAVIQSTGMSRIEMESFNNDHSVS